MAAIGIVAKLTIQEGKNAEFESVFKELVAEVKASEPGNLLYVLHKSRDSDTTYYVLEQYTDQAAVDAHAKSDKFQAASAKLGGVMAGRPEVTLMDAV
ncbi:MAG: putative quinol monooxygenase [Pseudomonadales bacterium]